MGLVNPPCFIFMTIQYNLKRRRGIKFIAVLGNGKFCWPKPIRWHEVIWKPCVTDVCWKKKMLWKGLFCRDSIIWIWVFLLINGFRHVLYLQDQSSLIEADSCELFRWRFDPLLHIIAFLNMFSIQKLFSFGCQYLGLVSRWPTCVLIITTESSLRNNLV